MTGSRDPQAFYRGGDSLHVEIYDALAAQNIAAGTAMNDIEFYRGLARETGGPILDVGCGTGRVSLALAADGHEVVGVDISAPMLRVAERNRAALSTDAAARLSFQQGDMATLSLGREFGLVITPFRVFQFALTSDAQRAALRAMRSHLRRDGRLVLDLFDPMLEYVVPAKAMPRQPVDVTHPITGNRVAWAITNRQPDPARQLIVEDWEFREYAPSGDLLRTETERLTLRWSLRAEMRLLFELEGLEVVADYGDFDGGPPVYGREQVWLLKKAGS
jgi:SAM-dependent methyltransferase